MGYFSNGTEGEMYEEHYCARCIHGQDEDKSCPVWFVHLLFNYDQHENKQLKAVLDELIPRPEVFNEECRMFVEAGE